MCKLRLILPGAAIPRLKHIGAIELTDRHTRTLELASQVREISQELGTYQTSPEESRAWDDLISHMLDAYPEPTTTDEIQESFRLIGVEFDNLLDLFDAAGPGAVPAMVVSALICGWRAGELYSLPGTPHVPSWRRFVNRYGKLLPRPRS